MLKRHSHRVKSEVKAATGLDSIFPAVPSPPASLCSVPDSYAYKDPVGKALPTACGRSTAN